MKRSNQWLILALIIIITPLLLLAYKNTKPSNKKVKTEPFKIVSVQGTDFKQVTLLKKAAERLGIETAPVREEWITRSGRTQNVVPYTSVIYGLHGETWAYTNPKPLVFVRQSIIIDYIDGGLAVLSEGPIADTKVVTVGVAELYGIETGIGK